MQYYVCRVSATILSWTESWPPCQQTQFVPTKWERQVQALVFDLHLHGGMYMQMQTEGPIPENIPPQSPKITKLLIFITLLLTWLDQSGFLAGPNKQYICVHCGGCISAVDKLKA